jgi:CheY-like chemotaxis protein
VQKVRRVLIVDDDEAQRGSLRQLLGSREVETVGAATAAECLDHLVATTFDCMVLDLSLPDASGFALLDRLSSEDRYQFPPVIIYTGRDLTQDEEQRLRKYSKSVIIKGAKSPERLLDEVTLFLHQVVADLPPEQQAMLKKSQNRNAVLEGRHILIVEDDVRNVFALTSILEPQGVQIQIARNGREGLQVLEQSLGQGGAPPVDLVLMDIMMPEMDGLTAMREIRKRPEWRKLPIIALTAKAMKHDQEQSLAAGANDYMAKPLDVDKMLSLLRVWMPR